MTIDEMKTAQLAHEVLKVLDQQAQYFKTRNKQDLIVSKQMEKVLRAKCAAALMAVDFTPTHEERNP